MAKREEEDKLRKSMASWISLFAEPIEWSKYLSVKEVRQGEGNIAGVKIPTYDGVDFNISIPDFFTTPVWRKSFPRISCAEACRESEGGARPLLSAGTWQPSV